MRKIVVAANVDADQPWLADAAGQLARQTGASVAVVSVDEVESQRFATLPRSEYIARAERAAAATVERLAAQGVEATSTVRTGRALGEILAFADEQDADMVVVGASVRGRLASALLGNVPLGLVERSRRPVMVVTGPMAPPATGSPEQAEPGG